MARPVTLELLDEWLEIEAEHETLEFKAGTKNYPKEEVVRYATGIANKKGGYLVLGVNDMPPRRVVGSNSFATKDELNAIKLLIRIETTLDVEITELIHIDGRVLVFTIPSRPPGVPIHVRGTFLTRSGESLLAMTHEEIRAIHAETDSDWLAERATQEITAERILELLDADSLFKLLSQQTLGTPVAICERLVSLRLVVSSHSGFAITNLGALVAARTLSGISIELDRKFPRFVIYDGINKLKTRSDYDFDRGYAVGFKALVEKVYDSAPQNHVIEKIIRTSIKAYPIQALRELIANALIHQDLSNHGSRVMIEMYDDRVEISNPGVPTIQVNRFIDEYQSRNDVLADIMRRVGICDEKGSGVDKVISSAEEYQLPAPEFRADHLRTTAILFGPKPFADMTQADRIRACYQHCCLMFVSNTTLSNQSLRKRFALSDNETSMASNIIAATKEANLIKLLPSATPSNRYSRYIPYWV